jgi:hypothetical protein
MTLTPIEVEKLNKDIEFMKSELELAESCLETYRSGAVKISLGGEVCKLHENLVLDLEKEIKILKGKIENRRNERY